MFVPGGANDRNDALVQQLAESFGEGAWDSDLGTGQGNKTRPLLAAICVASHLIHIYIYYIILCILYILTRLTPGSRRPPGKWMA